MSDPTVNVFRGAAARLTPEERAHRAQIRAFVEASLKASEAKLAADIAEGHARDRERIPPHMWNTPGIKAGA